MALPGTKVTNERSHKLSVDGRDLTVTELDWNDTDRQSFDIYVNVDGEDVCLTVEGAFDAFPTDHELRARLTEFDNDPPFFFAQQ